MDNIKIKVLDRKNEVLHVFEDTFHGTSDNVQDIKNRLRDQCAKLKKIPIEQFRLEGPNVIKGIAKAIVLQDKTKKVEFYFKDIEADDSGVYNLTFKNIGTQVSWTTVFLVEYFGPILITGLLLAARTSFWQAEKALSLSQWIGSAMVVCHYVKREFETLYVHRFSNDTMPIFNIFKNCSHYWLLMGLSMYFFLHPDYTQPAWTGGCKYCYYMLAGVFAFFEFMNLMCHITLRNLRPPGTTARGVPAGYGFDMVSCANYLWEGCAWTTFAIFSNTVFGYIFLIVSAGQMAVWAKKKQSNYRKDFPDYPRSRKACIPFIL